MKRKFALLTSIFSVFAFVLVGCSDDDSDSEIITVDTALPVGDFEVDRQGDLVAESGTPTQGTVQLGTDSEGTDFLRFSNDFTTELGTGTVAIFFSTSSVYNADPANGNPDLKLIGNVESNGEMFVKLNEGPEAKFTHVILWCATANIPFGNAELQ
ncbi:MULTISPECIES: DM13 domain-containing protein [Flavobacteriaceae]|uniref:DM13 domain-containing protein n=1 Tax=Flavobacteriaceae TaxID=49546 RepID=UPI00234ADD20|nr:DM13 domain-containing protein [Muricauda sp. SP22]MDC6363812.1 DM13 domain-containing protein [Muricauda sp. SP22]